MGVHAFNSSSQEAEEGNLCEFEASLIHIASPRTSRTLHRETLSRNKSIRKDPGKTMTVEQGK